MTRHEAPITPPTVLSIAGSDSGGGAGIQADVKTIEACGGFGTTAITSVTAQNTRGVRGSHLLPVDDIDAQITAVLDDFDVKAVKTGMLATREVIDLVADHADHLPTLVVDPVMVAASGDRLLAEAAESAYETLVAESTLVTPNADEAKVLTDVAVDSPEAAERAGRILVEDHGADAALVKGGHVAGDHVVDTLVTGPSLEDGGHDGDSGRRREGGDDDPQFRIYRHDRVDTDATHGSGCTLSSAIATHLAHGQDLTTAVGAGIDLLARAVRYNVDVGEGPGAVHHLVELRNDASRAATEQLLSLLVDRFRDGRLDALVPPSGVGLVGATPHAETPTDVAAVAGLLNSSAPDGTDGSRPCLPFDGDDALSSVLLAAREAAPAIRFAALVDGSHERLAALDGETIALENLDSNVDDPTPIETEALAPLAGAKRPPVAVSDGSDGRGPVVVFGETTAELDGRLLALADA